MIRSAHHLAPSGYLICAGITVFLVIGTGALQAHFREVEELGLDSVQRHAGNDKVLDRNKRAELRSNRDGSLTMSFRCTEADSKLQCQKKNKVAVISGRRGSNSKRNKDDDSEDYESPEEYTTLKSVPSYRTAVNCKDKRKAGPCKNWATRWYFNSKTGKCKDFEWGGCEPNGNNFATKRECYSSCKPPTKPTEAPYRTPPPYFRTPPPTYFRTPPPTYFRTPPPSPYRTPRPPPYRTPAPKRSGNDEEITWICTSKNKALTCKLHSVKRSGKSSPVIAGKSLGDSTCKAKGGECGKKGRCKGPVLYKKATDCNEARHQKECCVFVS